MPDSNSLASARPNRIGRAAPVWWLLAGLLVPVVFLGVAGSLVFHLGHDSQEQSATTTVVRQFNRLGLALRDFEVPLGDKPATVSWEVHYKLYRVAADS